MDFQDINYNCDVEDYLYTSHRLNASIKEIEKEKASNAKNAPLLGYNNYLFSMKLTCDNDEILIKKDLKNCNSFFLKKYQDDIKTTDDLTKFLITACTGIDALCTKFIEITDARNKFNDDYNINIYIDLQKKVANHSDHCGIEANKIIEEMREAIDEMNKFPNFNYKLQTSHIDNFLGPASTYKTIIEDIKYNCNESLDIFENPQIFEDAQRYYDENTHLYNYYK